MKLPGRVALITGGSEGMGFATAELFLREGAKVVISGRRQAKGLEAVKRLKKYGDILFVKGDVSKAADAKNMVEQTVKKHGRIDILFNNAGIYIEKLAEDMSEQEWNPFWGQRARLPFALIAGYRARAVPVMHLRGKTTLGTPLQLWQLEK